VADITNTTLNSSTPTVVDYTDRENVVHLWVYIAVL